MPLLSIALPHLALHSATDVHELFRLLGYNSYDPQPFEGDDLDQLELDEVDRDVVQRAYIIAQNDNHTVYLYEVNDLKQTRLRGLAWNALQRGTALLVITRDYREVLFVDPRFAGKSNKSSVRVNKLKLITNDPTRHDLDTLNAIHAHRRSGQQIYDAQQEAFNVTTITNRFYDEYRYHYELARDAATNYNKGVPEFQNEDQTDKLHAFVQRLLGRLMFLYFLQRKGWLGGKQKFLTDQYLATMRRHSDETRGDEETFYYYREVLEPLFFQTLNTKRIGNTTIWPGIFIPYLNGGLFDEARDPTGPIILPDALFDPNSDQGLLAFFNRYNFTVTDDTPLEQDVAVDPEMLGKVFENLLEERDRGQSGSYYTPRAIVAYMCQEALAGYLEESAGISREITRAQFDPDSELRFTPEQAEQANAALDTVTVLDPAVGSGSFMIGMLSEIIRLRKVCYTALNSVQEVESSVLADWKEAVIRDTLYGVDIKPDAIEIAQLRLWLALVVDQTIEQARPLPNLDYRLMAGNSLIETIDGEPILGAFAASILQPQTDTEWEHINSQLRMFDPNPVQGRMLLFDEEKQVEHERVQLDKLRRDFFRAPPDERRRLREEITTQERRIVYASLKEKTDALAQQIDYYAKLNATTGGKLKPADQKKLKTATEKIARITVLQEDMRHPERPLPFFLYHLHFNEVFERKGGFDVVIANPPYVRGTSLASQKDELRVTYPKVYDGYADLYVYFYARGVHLARTGGQIVYITSNKYLRAKYGKGLRGYLSTNVCLRTIADFGDLPVFDATAYPCIVVGSVQEVSQDNPVEVISIGELDALTSLRSYIATHAANIQQSQLGSDTWQIVDKDIRRVLDHLQTQNISLGEYVNNLIFRGIITGRNDVFVIDEKMSNQLIGEHESSREIIKPYLMGSDVGRWQLELGKQYLLFVNRGVNIDNYPAVLGHLSAHRNELESRSTVASHAWYELTQPQTGIFGYFSKPKIVFPDIADRPSFTLDNSGAFLADTTFTIPSNDLFLLGVLNSNSCEFFFGSISSQIRGGYYRFKYQYVKRIPIPNVLPALRDQIATIASQCLSAAKNAPEQIPSLEAELNELVYKAYGLDADDIAIIEGHLNGQHGENMGNAEEEDSE